MFHFQAHAVPARPQADPFICNTCITQTGQHSFTAIEYESAVVSFDVSVEVVHLMRSTQYHCLATRELNERNPIILHWSVLFLPVVIGKRNLLGNYVITIITVIQNDFINPWSTNPSYLTSDGKHCLIARQLKRTKATTVDYQIHGPVKNDFIEVTYFGRHEFSTNRNKTIEQVWQQAGWFTCERGEMITTGVRSTVLITESLQFRFLDLLAPEHYFLPRRLRISIGIGRKPHARL